MFAQRYVDNNPRMLDGLMGHFAPQPTRVMPLSYGEDTTYILGQYDTDLTTLSWSTPGDNLWFTVGVAKPWSKGLYVDGVKGRWRGFYTTAVDGTKLTAEGDWAWQQTGSVLFLYADSNPSSKFGSILRSQDAVVFQAPSKRYITRARQLYVPSRRQLINYPDPPQITLNYYHSAWRQYDIKEVKTLATAINVLDQNHFEDVIIQEIWGVDGSTLSALTNFIEALHVTTQEVQEIGKFVAWCPFDLSFARHYIQPLSVIVGSAGAQVREVREKLQTAEGSYADRTLTFTFKLARPQLLAGSNIIAEGY